MSFINALQFEEKDQKAPTKYRYSVSNRALWKSKREQSVWLRESQNVHCEKKRVISDSKQKLRQNHGTV